MSDKIDALSTDELRLALRESMHTIGCREEEIRAVRRELDISQKDAQKLRTKRCFNNFGGCHTDNADK